ELLGPGLGGVHIDSSVPGQLLGDGTTVRYRILGDFNDTGAVYAKFTRGTWSILDPIGAVSTIDLGDLTNTNDRTYLDVLYQPTVGGTLDTSSITDSGDEFMLDGTTVTVSDDAPISLGG